MLFKSRKEHSKNRRELETKLGASLVQMIILHLEMNVFYPCKEHICIILTFM